MAKVKPLNDWLASTIRKATRIAEDADRKSHAARMFERLIRDVHCALVTNAIRADRPKIARVVTEETVSLQMEWYDDPSGWLLVFEIARRLGEKPRAQLTMSGEPLSYEGEAIKENIDKALNDYFESWKREALRHA